MVAQKISIANERKRMAALIRRSPVISSSGYALYHELLDGWAWKKFTCFPSQETLAETLCTTVRTIRRLTQELVTHKVLEINRRANGLFYTLPSNIPVEVCDPARLDNKTLVAMARAKYGSEKEDKKRKQRKQTPGKSNRMKSSGRQSTSNRMKSSGRSEESNRMKSSGATGQKHPVRPDEIIRCDRMISSSEDVQEKMSKRSSTTEEEIDALRAPLISSASGHEDGVEENPQDSQEGETIVVTSSGDDGDLDDSLLDPSSASLGDSATTPSTTENKGFKTNTANRLAPRGKRSAQDDVVSLPERPVFGSGKPRTASKYEQMPPPPIKAEKDVWELLRGEIKLRWGESAGLHFGEMPSKIAGQIKQTLLRDKYAPQTLLAMIRVLVWDWEVVRITCWPHQPDQPRPTALQLVQYHQKLAAAAETGFTYPPNLRGKQDTYAERYLASQSSVVEPGDPF